MFHDTPPRPPFDPELADALIGLRQAQPPLTVETLPQMREAFRTAVETGAFGTADLTVGGKVTVEDVSVQRGDGEPDVPLLVLRPSSGTGPWPAIYHTHGGGMVVGSPRTTVSGLLPYVAEGLAVVVSVDYRLAPEAPDPAPVNDCYAGLVWVAEHSEQLSIDPGQILITGESAGGGLAAGTALMARDRGYPTLTHQILVCPMLDDRLQTPSSRMLEGEGIWDRNDNLFGWTALLGERRGGPGVSPYAAPARVEDPSGLPSTFIDVGAVESFRDEALDYARRLARAGVDVSFHMWGGGFHGFDGLAPHAAVSQAATWVRDNYFRRALTAGSMATAR
ncbi:Acetyl esterase/lipase [Arthrobacter sp. yr096]|uniref:alpha/beta hydrolase n=1 Tax=Arthrobacter sp. yr096 TaxID=1761750 RepID=UPI0008B2A97F|nr:alpha/beta hydrolase [Arthrobacter sp. yr096]SEJ33623.1 Acetyl esterase/lipase [Arthrobacter sp. yr096]